MPEKTNLNYKERQYSLRTAMENRARLLFVECRWCRIKRTYMIEEVIQLIGNVPVHNAADHFTCEKCKRKDYMVAEVGWIYEPDHIGKLTVRRVKRVYYVRQVEWKDEVL